MKERQYSQGGGIVALARTLTRLTQRELATRAGVPQATIARIETGAVSPTIETLTKILAAAGLEMRIQLAPLDRHDEILRVRHDRLSEHEKTLSDMVHEANVRAFKEAGQKAGLHRNRAVS